jgi:nucleotide-binding universal stress UspA family protein
LFNKILVPLDGSEYSNKALDIAIDLAQKYSGFLVIIHVIPSASTFITGPEASSAQILMSLRSELEESGQKILEEGTRKAQEAGIPVTSILEHGNISDYIISTAEKEKADLIVIGERGLGAVARFFLGSIANKVSHHATCPVLIARAH